MVETADSGEDRGFDLFGQLVVPLRERRGRPSYAKTHENQRFVEVRAAAGWSQEVIAADMGIDCDTLRKHFSVELQTGAFKVKGELLDVLRQRAREGHVPSVRVLNEIINATALRAPKGRKAADVPTFGLAEGKKAARLRDAQVQPEDYGALYDRLDKAH